MSQSEHKIVLTPEKRSLSEEFVKLSELCNQETILFSTLINNMTARGHALLTLIFGIPFMLPIPIPGLSVIFGFIIFVGGMAMALGQKPWVPKFIMDRTISSHTLSKVFFHGARISRKFEWLIKPRGRIIINYSWVRRFNGVLIGICGFLLALPLPPGTNFPPATAIILLSVAILQEDILFMIFGYLAFALNSIFFAAIFIYGFSGVQKLMGL